MTDLKNCKENLLKLKIETTLNEVDFSSKNISWKMAYICSLVCHATYSHIPEFEVEEANRLNIIVPCEEYRNICKSQMYLEAMRVYQDPELEGRSYSFTPIFREMLIALVVQTPIAIFVGIRGTENKFRAFAFPQKTTIEDWLVNLEASMIQYPCRRKDLVHRGFYNAVSTIYDEIIKIVSSLPRLPIYITGHSLGGAMAAILNAKWLNDISQAKKEYFYDQQMVEPVSCYVFGMPRYGNSDFIKNFSSPFHVYNQQDGVPTVPPRLFGCYYSDLPSKREFCLSEENAQPILGYQKGNAFLHFNDRKFEFLGVSAHFMERYISNLEPFSYQNEMKKGLISSVDRREAECGCIIISGLTLHKRNCPKRVRS